MLQRSFMQVKTALQIHFKVITLVAKTSIITQKIQRSVVFTRIKGVFNTSIFTSIFHIELHFRSTGGSRYTLRFGKFADRKIGKKRQIEKGK